MIRQRLVALTCALLLLTMVACEPSAPLSVDNNAAQPVDVAVGGATYRLSAGEHRGLSLFPEDADVQVTDMHGVIVWTGHPGSRIRRFVIQPDLTVKLSE